MAGTTCKSDGGRSSPPIADLSRPLASNPFDFWGKVLDCGDIPVTSYDNAYALQQIEEGHYSLLSREPYTSAKEVGMSKSGKALTMLARSHH